MFSHRRFQVSPLALLAMFCVSLITWSASLVHPGGWHIVADIERIREKLAAHAEPWQSATEKLLSSGPDFDYQPHAVASVTRGTGGVDQGGNSALKGEASDAYTLMIKWVATNDPRYGDAAIRILDAWSGTLKMIGGHDAILAAGIYGSKFAQAAELATYYKPDWPNKVRAQQMFREVFYPVIKDGASINWGTNCMTGITSIGVFCDDCALFDEGVAAYKNGFSCTNGFAGVAQYIDSSGECAESGRDQPCTQGGIGHLLETAVTAWNQGANLFPKSDNRLVTGLEYTAIYNLGQDAPYHPIVRADGKISYPNRISEEDRGRLFPVYEMAAAYFATVDIPAPFTNQILASPDYTPEITNNDHPGISTLAFCH